MTPEQLALLDQLLSDGFATKTIQLLGGKAEITISSLQTGNQLEIESYMKNVEGSPAYVMHIYSVKLLAQVLKKYHYIGKDPAIFGGAEKAEEFIKTRPSTITDAMIAAHAEFEKELAQIAKSENLEENFSETPSSEQKQS